MKLKELDELHHKAVRASNVDLKTDEEECAVACAEYWNSVEPEVVIDLIELAKPFAELREKASAEAEKELKKCRDGRRMDRAFGEEWRNISLGKEEEIEALHEWIKTPEARKQLEESAKRSEKAALALKTARSISPRVWNTPVSKLEFNQ